MANKKKKNNVKKDSEILKEKEENIKVAKKELYFENNSSTDELSKLIKIVLIVTVIMLVFYGITVVVTKKAKEATQKSEKATIQYDSVVIGSMLNMDGSYYILIEDEDDSKLSEYTTLLQSVQSNDDAPTVYTANLSSSFNSQYVSDESNYDSNLENFKVKGTTLVRVENHEIKDTYDTYDSITNKLNELD